MKSAHAKCLLHFSNNEVVSTNRSFSKTMVEAKVEMIFLDEAGIIQASQNQGSFCMLFVYAIKIFRVQQNGIRFQSPSSMFQPSPPQKLSGLPALEDISSISGISPPPTCSQIGSGRIWSWLMLKQDEQMQVVSWLRFRAPSKHTGLYSPLWLLFPFHHLQSLMIQCRPVLFGSMPVGSV